VKTSTLFLYATLAASPFAVAQSNASGSAATQSRTSVSATPDGAAASNTGSGSASVKSDKANADLAQGTEINATLSKPVDSRKAKPGDEVVATTNDDVKSDGKVIVPRGSRLVGHVTSARPHSKPSSSDKKETPASTANKNASAAGEAGSQLGIVFDKAVLKDGREVPLNAGIQALAAGSAAADGGLSESSGAMSGASNAGGSARGTGGGLVGGASGAVGGTLQGAGNATGAIGSTADISRRKMSGSAGAVGGIGGAGRFAPDSRGVFGMKGLDISAAGAGNASGSVISSTTRDVKLERGTRMLLTANGNAAGGASAAGSATGSAGNNASSVNGAANGAASGTVSTQPASASGVPASQPKN
jgi:hypothetical protein